MDLLQTLFPNVVSYNDIFVDSIIATFQMFAISGILTFVIGLAFGIALTVTRPDGIAPNKIIFGIDTLITNFFRSIPFVILLIFLIPLTRLITGTAIGVAGAIVPLVFGAVPFYTRQVETALVSVDKGKIEAARAFGSGTMGIIFRVYLPEALPELIRATTITAISLIGLTTMAGAVGAGGIGSFAIKYGQNLHHQDVVNACVILLMVIISIIQGVGNLLARRTTNRHLFGR